MAYSNRSVALRFSKALFKHRYGAAAAPPFSATAAFHRLHVDTREESDVTGVKAEELTTELAGEGVVTSTMEVAYDATKGTREKVKDTIIAKANENVVDTTEYRSMEDKDDDQKQ